jgi:hypothetical protein
MPIPTALNPEEDGYPPETDRVPHSEFWKRRDQAAGCSEAKKPSTRSQISTPPKSRGDLGQNRLQNMRVVGDTQLVRDGQQQCIGFGDRVVFSELFDEHIRLGGIATAENCTRIIDVADLVVFLRAASEVEAIAIIS